MKLTRHKDGSYSFTEMTAYDVQAFDFATAMASAWYATSARTVFTDDPTWNQRQQAMYDDLHKLTNIVRDARHSGSIVTRPNYMDADFDKRYQTYERRGLLSWAESDAQREAKGGA